jgi:predicted TPR repeat methyltransferase
MKSERSLGTGLPAISVPENQIRQMLFLIPTRRYKRALDLGCGLGNLTRRLRNHADQVLGIDVSHVAIAQATRETTEQSPAQVSPVQRSAEDISGFDNQMF